MTYEITIAATAEQDILQATNYIDHILKNPQAADRLLDEFEKQIADLAIFPEKFALANDPVLHSWGLRFVPIKNYLAFYKVSHDKQLVMIVRFLYAKSNWKTILRNELPD